MEFRPFRVELSTPFRGATQRSGVLVRGATTASEWFADGCGWGEFSPFPDYDSRRANLWWAAALEAAQGDWPQPVRDHVAVNSIVPAVAPAHAARLALAGGCATAKVKVGGVGADFETTLAADLARTAAVAAALSSAHGSAARVRVDANGAWDVEQALRALVELNAAVRDHGLPGLEFAEQPCSSVGELAQLRRRTDTLIAADESVRLPADPMEVVRAGGADIVVLKVSPLGGVRACLRIADQVGVPVVVSSAMESSVGVAAGLALARALPNVPYASGLGTGALLATDTVRATLAPSGGMLSAVTLDVTA